MHIHKMCFLSVWQTLGPLTGEDTLMNEGKKYDKREPS